MTSQRHRRIVSSIVWRAEGSSGRLRAARHSSGEPAGRGRSLVSRTRPPPRRRARRRASPVISDLARSRKAGTKAIPAARPAPPDCLPALPDQQRTLSGYNTKISQNQWDLFWSAAFCAPVKEIHFFHLSGLAFGINKVLPQGKLPLPDKRVP